MSANLLDVIQKSARKGTLLASCEPEVKELMRQIDVLLASQQSENSYKVDSLKAQLQQREREMSALRVAIQEKTTQVEKMRDDVKRLELQLRVQSSDHETHLLRMKSELNRLGKNYDKLKLRKGLSEEKESQMSAIKEQLEELKSQHETNQSQIAKLSEQLSASKANESSLHKRNITLEEELKVCREELSMCNKRLSQFENKSKESMTLVESQLKISQDSVKSREKKIQSLRLERDELRKKSKTILLDCKKLQEAIATLSNENQNYQVGVADLKLQLTKEQSNLQNCLAEKAQLQHQLTASQELIRNKEKLIKSLDSHYKNKIDSEISLVSARMKELQGKLEGSKKIEIVLREENTRLKEKVKTRQSSCISCSSGGSGSNVSIPVQQSPGSTEIQNYRAKLMERSQLVSALEERVQHLEEQLSEATSLAQSSSSSLYCVSRGDSLSVSELKMKSPAPSPPLSDTPTGTTPSARGSAAEDPPLVLQSSSSTVNSNNSSLSIGSESAATPTKDKLKRVSEHFCLGMRSLAAPVSGATPTSSNHSSIALDEFRSSLNTVLSEHINKINESLKNVLEEKEN